MAYLIDLFLFIVVAGLVDATLPWPKPGKSNP
jgi:hypothetical protein